MTKNNLLRSIDVQFANKPAEDDLLTFEGPVYLNNDFLRFQTRQTGSPTPDSDPTIIKVVDNAAPPNIPNDANFDHKQSFHVDPIIKERDLKAFSRHPEVSRSQMKGNCTPLVSFLYVLSLHFHFPTKQNQIK